MCGKARKLFSFILVLIMVLNVNFVLLAEEIEIDFPATIDMGVINTDDSETINLEYLINDADYNLNKDITLTDDLEDFIAESEEVIEEVILEEMSLEATSDVDSIFDNLSVDEKIAQLLQVDVSDLSSANEVVNVGLVTIGEEKLSDSRIEIDELVAANILIGADATHGASVIKDSTFFPSASALGAYAKGNLQSAIIAAENAGAAVAAELKAAGINMAIAPSMAVVSDIRWGSTFESFSSDEAIVKALSSAYIKGLNSNATVVAAKNYIAAGQTRYGLTTGDALVNNDEISAHVDLFKSAIENGAKIITVSKNTVNGIAVIDDKELIDKVKENFDGVIVAEVPSGKVASALANGVDVICAGSNWQNIKAELESFYAVNPSRIEDAVKRVLQIKIDAGVYDDEKVADVPNKVANKALAREIVSNSLVLLKNKSTLLNSLSTAKSVLVTGAAANNIGLQSGPYTITNSGGIDANGVRITDGSTLLEGFRRKANGTSFTYSVTGALPPTIKPASFNAAIVVVSDEKLSPGSDGDTSTLKMTDADMISIANTLKLGIPTILITLSGRPLDLYDYITNDNLHVLISSWLPGSEGNGVADILFDSNRDFTGKLPFAWPWTASQLDNTHGDNWGNLFEEDYGLNKDTLKDINTKPTGDITPNPNPVEPPIDLKQSTQNAILNAVNYINVADGVAKTTAVGIAQGLNKENITGLDAGRWTEYAVKTTDTGTYSIKFNVLSDILLSNALIIDVNGKKQTVSAIPQATAWSSPGVATTDVYFPAGDNILKVYSAQSGWQLHSMEFTYKNSSDTRPAPHVVEYKNQSGLPVNNVINSADFSAFSMGIALTNDGNLSNFNEGKFVSYNLNVKEKGAYDILIEGSGNGVIALYVDDAEITTDRLPISSSGDESSIRTVVLQDGIYELKLQSFADEDVVLSKINIVATEADDDKPVLNREELAKSITVLKNASGIAGKFNSKIKNILVFGETADSQSLQSQGTVLTAAETILDGFKAVAPTKKFTYSDIGSLGNAKPASYDSVIVVISESELFGDRVTGSETNQIRSNDLDLLNINNNDLLRLKKAGLPITVILLADGPVEIVSEKDTYFDLYDWNALIYVPFIRSTEDTKAAYGIADFLFTSNYDVPVNKLLTKWPWYAVDYNYSLGALFEKGAGLSKYEAGVATATNRLSDKPKLDDQLAFNFTFAQSKGGYMEVSYSDTFNSSDIIYNDKENSKNIKITVDDAEQNIYFRFTPEYGYASYGLSIPTFFKTLVPAKAEVIAYPFSVLKMLAEDSVEPVTFTGYFLLEDNTYEIAVDESVSEGMIEISNEDNDNIIAQKAGAEVFVKANKPLRTNGLYYYETGNESNTGELSYNETTDTYSFIMPEYNITIMALFQDSIQYDFTFNQVKGGYMEVSYSESFSGSNIIYNDKENSKTVSVSVDNSDSEIYFRFTPEYGYFSNGLQIPMFLRALVPTKTEIVSYPFWVLEMLAEDSSDPVVFTGNFVLENNTYEITIDKSVPSDLIKLSAADNDNIIAQKAGEKVTVTANKEISPNGLYYYETGNESNTGEMVYDEATKTYSFIMPEYNITVMALFHDGFTYDFTFGQVKGGYMEVSYSESFSSSDIIFNDNVSKTVSLNVTDETQEIYFRFTPEYGYASNGLSIPMFFRALIPANREVVSYPFWMLQLMADDFYPSAIFTGNFVLENNTYEIAIDKDIDGGKLNVSCDESDDIIAQKAGNKVTVKVTPSDNKALADNGLYYFETANESNTGEVVYDAVNDTYTFDMPAYDITITAVFKDM